MKRMHLGSEEHRRRPEAPAARARARLCGGGVLPVAVASLLLLISLAHAGVAAQTRAFVLTSDFSTGSLSVVDLDTRGVSLDVEPAHSDAVARWYQGELYVVNRFGQDNIQVISGTSPYTTVRQFSTGNGTNPQDIAFVSASKAYVSRYGAASLMIVNPTTGASFGEIDLTAFADSDGIPEMARMIRVGSMLFVALQRLTSFLPSGASLVAVVDTEADTVLDVNPALAGKQAIALAAQNPATTFAYDAAGRRLLIGCAGAFGALDGGVEAIDPVTLESLGLVISEAALGGDIGDIAWHTAGRSYAIVSDASYNASLVAWSALTGTSLGTVFSPGGFSLPDCALNDRGELYVCHNDFMGPGVRVFSAASGAPLAGPLDAGLPPQQVVFDEADDAVLAVASPRAGGAKLGPPLPNPAKGAASFTLRLDRAGEVRVEVFDLGGRRVRGLLSAPLAAGARALTWDLRNDRGNRVLPGLYLIRASSRMGTVSTKLTVLD